MKHGYSEFDRSDLTFDFLHHGNLELLDTRLDVHCAASSYIGRITFPLIENTKLSNTAAILILNIPGEAEIIDG